MPVDPLSDEILSFTAAAKRLPRLRAGRPTHPSTLWRWATHGVRGVKLETCKVGGTSCTSVEALRRFFARLNGETPTMPPPAGADRAAVELDRIGI